jgi:hypothetical protein
LSSLTVAVSVVVRPEARELLAGLRPDRPSIVLAHDPMWFADVPAGPFLMGSDTGVYMGLWSTEYQAKAMKDARSIDAYALLGTMHSAVVGRLSWPASPASWPRAVTRSTW